MAAIGPGKPSKEKVLSSYKNKRRSIMVQEKFQKGPWTEQEDLKLASSVGLFGARIWDFIAKVSGLNRTGKSCRLRWVNYLHPGLKRSKMTPQEELLVIDLQSKWGNRWSKIARKLPGRTDNEIKNYWRTHMRKKAQDKMRGLADPPSASTTSTTAHFSNIDNHHALDSHADASSKEAGKEISSYHTGGPHQEFSMDDIWNDIDLSEENIVSNLQQQPVYNMEEACCNFSYPSLEEYSLEQSLWEMDEQSMLFTMPDPYFSCNSTFLTS